MLLHYQFCAEKNGRQVSSISLYLSCSFFSMIIVQNNFLWKNYSDCCFHYYHCYYYCCYRCQMHRISFQESPLQSCFHKNLSVLGVLQQLNLCSCFQAGNKVLQLSMVDTSFPLNLTITSPALIPAVCAGDPDTTLPVHRHQMAYRTVRVHRAVNGLPRKFQGMPAHLR
jgi:hypothetical protein